MMVYLLAYEEDKDTVEEGSEKMMRMCKLSLATHMGHVRG